MQLIFINQIAQYTVNFSGYNPTGNIPA